MGRITTSLFLSLFLLLAISLSQAIPHDIRVTLELDNLQFNQQEQTELQARIKFDNKGEHISFPEIAFPSEEMKTRMFSVISTTTGKEAKYIGKSAQYLLSKVPLVYLPSLHSISSSVNLLNFYHFEEDGEYEVKLNEKVPLLEGGNIHLTSNGAIVKVSGASPYISHPSNSKRTVTYNSCTLPEQSELDGITIAQSTSVSASLSYLLNGCTNNGYDEFFGTDHSYDADVTDTFQNLSDLLSFSGPFSTVNYIFDCSLTGCSTGDIAYVTPADTTHTIYLCSEFWNQDDNPYSFNSKAGAVTNQMVRFDDVAFATSEMFDYETTVSNCLLLAEQSPIDARRNPYSYQYFQEVFPYCGEFNLYDCYSFATPTDYYVDVCSNVCNNLALDIPFFCDPAPRKDPLNDVVAETTAGINPNYWTKVGDVNANTFANITDLQPGSTYYFTTCRLSDSGDYYDTDPLLPFPTAIVIRDPSDNILEYNFGCYSCDADDLNGALVEYTHSSTATFSNIFVNVYANPYPQQTTTPTSCNRESSTSVPLYQRVDLDVTCTVYLQPLYTTPNFFEVVLSSTTGLATIDASDVSNSASATFCDNTETFTVSPNSFDCADVGIVPVTVTQTGGPQSIQTQVKVVDNNDPSITCINDQWLDGRYFTYGEFCVTDPFYDQFTCYIHNNQLNLNAYVDVSDNCGISLKQYEITSTNPTNAVTIGNTLAVSYRVVDYNDNDDSEDCIFNLYGLYINNIPTQTTVYPPPKSVYDIYFKLSGDSGALSGATAYLYLSSVTNKGYPYDFTDDKYVPLTLQNIKDNALDSIPITGPGDFFEDVEFPVKKSRSTPGSFKLTVALETTGTPFPFVLSYADPVVYLY